jgi:hypothetical protein
MGADGEGDLGVGKWGTAGAVVEGEEEEEEEKEEKEKEEEEEEEGRLSVGLQIRMLCNSPPQCEARGMKSEYLVEVFFLVFLVTIIRMLCNSPLQCDARGMKPKYLFKVVLLSQTHIHTHTLSLSLSLARSLARSLALACFLSLSITALRGMCTSRGLVADLGKRVCVCARVCVCVCVCTCKHTDTHIHYSASRDVHFERACR